MNRLRPILFLLVLLLAACDQLNPNPPTPTPALQGRSPVPQEPTTAPPTTTARPPTTPAPSPTAGGAISPATQQQIAKIERQAAELRGLTPRTDVPEYFVSDAQMKENLKADLNREYPTAEATQDALELWLLRYIERRDTDLRQIQIDLLGEQVLGYYDQTKNELFVRNDQQPLGANAQETLAHEFIHSLQDEYYDLEKLVPEDSGDQDRNSAARALVEGDATIAGILYAQQYMTAAELQEIISASANAPTGVLDRAPLYIRESLLFAYDAGVKFTLELEKRGRFAAVDRAFRDPPVSSEQILHPEKYLNTPRDLPQPVTLPPLTDTLGAGWTMKESDTLGEFDLGALLRTYGVDEAAASEGWGGARYDLYLNGNDGLVAVLTRWDNAADDDEFAAALRKTLAGAQEEQGIWAEDGRYTAIVQTGEQVAFIGGTARAAVERAAAAFK